MIPALDEVDPFIGVDGPGSTLCGPYYPLGLVRLSPDTVPPHRTHGYQSDLPLMGFSHTHVSGTGGEGRFGNVRLIPYVGPHDRPLAGFERSNERAEVGYYGVTLLPDGIDVELTATARVGVSRFRFPAGRSRNVLIDASAVHMYHPERHAECIESKFTWVGDRSFVGQGVFAGGWGHNEPYRIFFAGELDSPPDSTRQDRKQGTAHWFAQDQPLQVEIRIGVSFVSCEKAAASLQKEVNGKSFERIQQVTRDAWKQWFDRVQIQGGTTEERTIFHTFLTRLLCMPSDLGIEDEFDHWPSQVRHFSEIYCLWDSVRNANSLLLLFAPELQRDLLNCLLDIAEQRGWFPDAWITGHSTKVQGGSSADILFNEACLKRLDGIDYSKALIYMRKNNEVVSDDPYSYGRYLTEYHDLGFVSTNTINCVSRHLEYAYQDWCTGSLAAKLGDSDLATASFTSAAKVWNLWNDELQHFAPKDPAGSWAQPFDVNVTLPDSWNDPYFYEGRSRAWSYNTQHDFAGLVARCGGELGFEAHLDRYFADKLRVTKETFMHIPLLYHYAARPDKSSAMLRSVLSKAYSTARNGLPDNEDMGCHSAFYICGMIGLYPMMGQDWYFLTAPAFTHSEIALGRTGKRFVISAPEASPDHLYIASAKLNGRPLHQAWITHDMITAGAVLAYELSTSPTTWGRSPTPPSPMSNALID